MKRFLLAASLFLLTSAGGAATAQDQLFKGPDWEYEGLTLKPIPELTRKSSGLEDLKACARQGANDPHVMTALTWIDNWFEVAPYVHRCDGDAINRLANSNLHIGFKYILSEARRTGASSRDCRSAALEALTTLEDRHNSIASWYHKGAQSCGSRERRKVIAARSKALEAHIRGMTTGLLRAAQ